MIGLWLALSLLVPAVLISYTLILRFTNGERKRAILKELGLTPSSRIRFIGFFHPYCNAGGGGERVLWTAIKAMQRTEPNVVNVVYSGDTDASKAEIIAKVKARFDIALEPRTLHFVFLEKRNWVEDKSWPRFTLIGQSLGSMYLAWEAVHKLIPDLYIDTMGYAFTFHIFWWLGGISVGAYVHYPTISTDMLDRVASRKAGVTNSSAISSSNVLTNGKLLYYRLFMYYYAQSLRRAQFLMANSSWTKNHIDEILKYEDEFLDWVHLLVPPLFILKQFLSFGNVSLKKSGIVYPPCDTREMAQLPLEGRQRVILSIAQFRPEKDHISQVVAFHELLQSRPEFTRDPAKEVRLVLIGGSRNSEDAARIEKLEALAKELGVSKYVTFLVNAPFSEMLTWLGKSSIGLSTMVDEHFGINIVEYMAAGVIPVTHASGGPFNDIVIPVDGQPTGFHATSPAIYADLFARVLNLPEHEELDLRRRTRAWAVRRFSEEEFEKSWEQSEWRRFLRQ